MKASSSRQRSSRPLTHLRMGALGLVKDSAKGWVKDSATRLGALSLLLSLGLLLSVAACGGADRRNPPPVQRPPHGGEGGSHPGIGGEGGSGASDSVGPECEPGEQRDCTVYVPQANGVTSCWKGVKLCVDGELSECLDPGSVVPATGG
jgi:hypothetical protein